MMKETIKKELVGKVVSATNNKTITVLVETYKTHPLYHKRVKQSKKYAVHDETIKQKLVTLYVSYLQNQFQKQSVSI